MSRRPRATFIAYSADDGARAERLDCVHAADVLLGKLAGQVRDADVLPGLLARHRARHGCRCRPAGLGASLSREVA